MQGQRKKAAVREGQQEQAAGAGAEAEALSVTADAEAQTKKAAVDQLELAAHLVDVLGRGVGDSQNLRSTSTQIRFPRITIKW